MSLVGRNLITSLSSLLIVIVLLASSVAPDEGDYSYRYSVEEPESGVVTHRWEKKHGGHVRGGYSFLDADGKIRVVEYTVDGRKGFKAFVTFRRPPGQFAGHLRFPDYYRKPVRLAEPVGLITPDLFRSTELYPQRTA